MFSWLLVNVVLSALALLFITLNASAPHRLRFLVSFIALLAWSIPWQLVPEFMPQWQAFDVGQLERSFTANTAEYSLRPVVIMTTGLPLARDFFAFTWMQLGFMTLCATGLLLFFWHTGHHYLRLRQLYRNGEDGTAILGLRGLSSPVPVTIQNEIAGAFSSGLIRPRIWIHKELAASNQLATLLCHELTHIRQHDNWYLLCITFIEKLFWWNPLVQLLGRQARELQELSCDALCQRASADYPLQLAELMIDNARLNPVQGGLLLNANIFSRTNLNIKRIKLLQRSYAMKARHFVSIVVTAVGAVATIGIVTAQPEAGVNQRMFVRGQAVELSRDGSTGDVVFIANGPVAGTPGRQVMSWRTVGPGTMNQFIKANVNDGGLEISLDFTNTPLPMILEPLAGMVANDGMPAFGPGAPAVPPGPPNATHVFSQQIIQGSVSTAPVAAVRAGEVVMFHTEALPPGAEPFNVPVAGVAAPAMPFASRVVMEDEADRERLVSVQAENVSIAEALEIIGAEANCNIFLEDDTIVVNSCAN